MYADIPRDMARAREEAGIVLACRFDAGSNVGGVAQEPYFLPRAEGQPGPVHGQPHRLIKSTDQRGQSIAAGPHREQLIALIGADQERSAELTKQRDEAVGLRVLKGDWFRRRLTCWNRAG